MKHRQVKKLYKIHQQLNIKMSSLTGLTGRGVTNPLAGLSNDNILGDIIDTSDEKELVRSLESQ